MADVFSLSTLYDSGAHMVLCSGKQPLYRGWQKHRPDFDVIESHTGDLGLIPYSVGLSALDVDEGDILPLVERYPAAARVNTPRGHHLYYADDRPRGNSNWAAYGCSGQVRSQKGFLRLYGDAIDTLADTILTENNPAFPVDLLSPKRGGGGTFAIPSASEGGGYSSFPRGLEECLEGKRHPALWDTVRFWSYRAEKGKDPDEWATHVLGYALEANNKFPDPLPEDEVFRLARSVSSYCWIQKGLHDLSATVQRRRQGRQAAKRRARNADRDTNIRADCRAGTSLHGLSRRYGISRTAIRNILKRR